MHARNREVSQFSNMKYADLGDALETACPNVGDSAIVKSNVPLHGHDLIKVKHIHGAYRLCDVEGGAVAAAFGEASHLVCSSDFFNKLHRGSFVSRGFTSGVTPQGSKTTGGNLSLVRSDLQPTKAKGKAKAGDRKSIINKPTGKVKKERKKQQQEAARKDAIVKAVKEARAARNKETALNLVTFRKQNGTKHLEDIIREQLLAVFGNLVRTAVVTARTLATADMERHLAHLGLKLGKPYTIRKERARLNSYSVNMAELLGEMPTVGGIQAEDKDHALVLVALMGMAKVLARDFNVREKVLLELTKFTDLHTAFDTFPEYYASSWGRTYKPDPVLTTTMKLHFQIMATGELPAATKAMVAQDKAATAEAALQAAIAAVAPAQELARQATAAASAAAVYSSDEDVTIGSLIRS